MKPIEPGQLRRWKEGFDIDFDGTMFMVVGEREDSNVHLRLWRILIDGEICGGWTDNLLEDLSEVVNEAG